MSKVRAICPNHGVVKEIEMACTWVGKIPSLETDFKFCPKCGARTVIERDVDYSQSASYTYTYPSNDNNDYKQQEINRYREKYKKEFGLE